MQLSLILLSISSRIWCEERGYEFRRSNGSAGILFVPTQEVQLTFDEWHLCYYYDLGLFLEETKYLGICLDQLKTICADEHMAGSRQLCETITQLFELHSNSVSMKEEVIDSFKSAKIRRRRAPLEFVGNAMSFMFGVMDQEQAKKYSEDIEKLTKDQNYINQLTQQQTTLVEAAIKANNYSFVDLKNRIDSVQDDLRELKDAYFSGDIEAKLKMHFNLLAHATSLTLSHHNELANTIVKLLTNTLQGKMIDIIPFNRLRNQLIEIGKVLPKEKELPIDPHKDNLFQILLMSSIRTVLLDKRLFIEISFPVVLRKTYQLTKAISIPSAVGDRLIMIQPGSEYFLTNRELTLYIPMTESENQNCIERLNNRYSICSVSAPSQNRPEDVCELQMLRERFSENALKNCEYREIPKRNYIIRLAETNTYFIQLLSDIEIRVICTNLTRNDRLTETGFLDLRPDCSIESDDFSLKAHNVHELIDQAVVVPNFDVSHFQKPSTLPRDPAEKPRTRILEGADEDYYKLVAEMTEIRAKQQMTGELGAVHDKLRASNAVFGVCITLTITLVIVLFVIHALRKRHREAEPEQNNDIVLEEVRKIKECDEPEQPIYTKVEKNRPTSPWLQIRSNQQ